MSESKPFEGISMKSMSGTSVATSFAVALVANIWLYERANDATVSSPTTAQYHEGMRKLLKAMSEESGRCIAHVVGRRALKP